MNSNSADQTAINVSSHVVVAGHDVGIVTVPESLTLAAGKTTNVAMAMKVSWSGVSLLAQLEASHAPVPCSVDAPADSSGFRQIPRGILRWRHGKPPRRRDGRPRSSILGRPSSGIVLVALEDGESCSILRNSPQHEFE